MIMSKVSFPLRLQEDERSRGRRLADELGVSENRLYAELIHDGLLIREQMRYMNKLRDIAAKTSKENALAILDQVPDAPPISTDIY
jgi:isopentenyldiphosphate isomerase